MSISGIRGKTSSQISHFPPLTKFQNSLSLSSPPPSSSLSNGNGTSRRFSHRLGRRRRTGRRRGVGDLQRQWVRLQAPAPIRQRWRPPALPSPLFLSRLRGQDPPSPKEEDPPVSQRQVPEGARPVAAALSLPGPSPPHRYGPH